MPVGRKAQVDFRARRSIPRFQRQLECTPVQAWPKPLVHAWEILNDKFKLPPKDALSVILESVSAAHQCISAQSQQLTNLEQEKARTIIRKACGRISKGIGRAPAPVRRRLDRAILPMLQHGIVDLEIIESILAAATAIFYGKFAKGESLKATRRALRELRVAPFSMLGMDLRRRIEKAIADIAASSGKRQSIAADVFGAATAVLDADNANRSSSQATKSITGYVAELAKIWRRAGLKPKRAYGFLNSEYRATFHRFAEFVLEGVAPPSERSSNRELVSDYHLRTAL
jgi:hypothetical protein